LFETQKVLKALEELLLLGSLGIGCRCSISGRCSFFSSRSHDRHQHLPCVTALTPLGNVMSARCKETPFFKADKSTLMASGKSAGKQAISSSFMMWLIKQASTLTAGDVSSPV